MQRVPALLLIAAGCTVDPSQLVVVVDTDMGVPGELSAFRARVTAPGDRTTLDEVYALDGEARVLLPASFGVRPKDGDADRSVTIAIEALRDGTLLFETRAVTGFVEDERLRLDMFLAERCITETCDAGQTCREDGCVGVDVDPNDLPIWREHEPLSARDAGSAEDAGPGGDAGGDLDGGRPENCELERLDSPYGNPVSLALGAAQAFVACRPDDDGLGAGIWALDVSDPAAPTETGFAGGLDAFDVAVSGDAVLVTEGSPQLTVLDATDLLGPRGHALWVELGAFADAVTASADWAFVASGDVLLKTVDISDPDQPAAEGTLLGETEAVDVALLEPYVYVATGAGVAVVDVSTPDTPVSLATATTDEPALTVSVIGGLLLAGLGSGAITVFGLADPRLPEEATTFALEGEPGPIALYQQSGIAAWGTGGLKIIDLQDAANARELRSYAQREAVHGVVVDGDRVYVAADESFWSMSFECLGF